MFRIANAIRSVALLFLASALFAGSAHASDRVLVFKSSKPNYLGDVKVTIDGDQVKEITAYLSLDKTTKSFTPRECEKHEDQILCGMYAKESGNEYLFGAFLFSPSPNNLYAELYQSPRDVTKYEKVVLRVIAEPKERPLTSEFLGSYSAKNTCVYSGTKRSLFVEATPDNKSLILKLRGDDLALVEILMGSGTRPSPGSTYPDATETYETQMSGTKIISKKQFAIGNKVTGGEEIRVEVSGNLISIWSKSSFLPKAKSCVFVRNIRTRDLLP